MAKTCAADAGGTEVAALRSLSGRLRWAASALNIMQWPPRLSKHSNPSATSAVLL